ncbi:hypothetical protein D9M68_19400 [compost metagenome]
MPVPQVGNIDTTVKQPEVSPVTVQPKTYSSAVVDTSAVRFDLLTTYVAGQAWDVDYFSMIRGRDDDARPFESALHPVYQQYRLIKGLELKVTSPLSSSQDSETKDFTLSGTANVYGVLIPTEGDVFLADIGDGREGLMTITASRKLSHYNSAVYEIEYTLSHLSSAALRADLELKTQQTSVFHKDFLESGNDPMLSEAQTENVNHLKEHYGRLIALYFHDFYSRDFKTLLVPNQPVTTYDPFLIKYLKTILTTDDHPMMRHITEFNVQGDQAMYEFTFWNCLETADHAMLSMSIHHAGIADVKNFYNGRPGLNSIYYTGVKAVIYPDMSPTYVDSGYCPPVDPGLTKLMNGSTRFRELNRFTRTDLTMDPTLEIYQAISPERAPQIKRVTVDDYYVLSKEFYLHTPETKLSKLETLTMAALKGDAIDVAMLDDLCTGAPKWDNVERFYYFPILFTLLRVYRRRIK